MKRLALLFMSATVAVGVLTCCAAIPTPLLMNCQHIRRRIDDDPAGSGRSGVFGFHDSDSIAPRYVTSRQSVA